MRNGPLVHRHAHVSRTFHSSPSPLDRFAAINALAERRPLRAPAVDSLWQASRLNLGSRLPLNLRDFLAEQLGPSMRVENDSIVALHPRPGSTVMRDLARAIRRFSAQRARQVWNECAISIARLRAEFFRTPVGERCPVILCLRCACVGAGPLDEHGGPNCMPVNLDSALKDFAETYHSESAASPDAIIDAIENFRLARDAADLPHYDLDCFVASRQLVFTWRPLPPGHLK